MVMASDAARGLLTWLDTVVYLCPQKLWKLGDCCRPTSDIIVDAPATGWRDF